MEKLKAPRWEWLLVCLLVLVPFVFGVLTIQNWFYQSGGYYHDMGWHAKVMCRSGWSLQNPPNEGRSLSFYEWHVVLLFSLISALSELVPWSHVAVYSCYMGGALGLLALATYLVLRRWFAEPTAASMLFCGGLAWLFSLGGISLTIFLYPHFEILLPPLHLLFFYFWLQRRWAPSLLMFLLALGVREDAGFHLASVSGLLAVYRWSRGEGYRVWMLDLAWAFAGVALSVGLFAAQKLCFPGHVGLFKHEYLGEPAFAHLSGELLLQRSVAFLKDRTFLWLSMLVLLGSAIYTRKPAILLGFAACLPWTVLHFFARAGIPASLSAYYAFPFLTACTWLLLGMVVDSPQGLSAQDRRRTLYCFLILTVVGNLCVWRTGDIPRAWRGLPPTPELLAKDKIWSYVDSVHQAESALKEYRVDGAFLSLAANWVPSGHWPIAHEPLPQVSTFLFNDSYLERDLIATHLLGMPSARHWKLPGTHWMLAHSPDVQLPVGLRELLKETPPIQLLQTAYGAEVVDQGYRCLPTGGVAMGMRYQFMPMGKALARYDIQVLGLPGDKHQINIHAAVKPEGKEMVHNRLVVPLNQGSTGLEVPFEVLDSKLEWVDIFLDMPEGAEILVTGFRVTRAN